MREKIVQIFTSVIPIEEIDLNDSLSIKNNDAWDSIGHINFVAAIEEEFDIEFTSEEIATLMEFKNIVPEIEKKVVERTDG